MAERLLRIGPVRSRHLGNAREVVVCLPPGYDEAPERRYPVLYLQDGQNLFDPATSYVPGKPWRLGEAAEERIAGRTVEPLVLVGVFNTGAARVDEYTPTRSERSQAGGKADLYGRFLVEELKPHIDARLRTRPGRETTGLAGSSLGGLLTLHLGLRYPDVFSRLGVMSPSVWWDREVILRTVRALERKPSLRIWLDIGTAEGDRTVAGARKLRQALVEKGWRPGGDLHYLEAEGAAHDEAAWGARAGDMLAALYPRKRGLLRRVLVAMGMTEAD